MHASNSDFQVQKRLESNLKGRRCSRLSLFDRIRNLPRCESPAPLSEAQQKVEQRRKQLEKWKEEKEKRKKELASQKKKPFVAGVPHNPLKFVPPPPPRAMPSTSGRVTRSQAAKNNVTKQKVELKPVKVETKPKAAKSSQSFAPKNASFRPPEIKNLTKVPLLEPVTKTRMQNDKYTFNFNTETNIAKINTEITLTQTRPKSAKPVEPRMTTRRAARELEKATTNSRVTKMSSPVKKVVKSSKNLMSGSSSSDIDSTVKSVLRKPSPKVAKTTKNIFSSSSSEDTTESKPIMKKQIQKETRKSKNESSLTSSSEVEIATVKKSTRKSISKPVVAQSSTSDLDSSASEKSPILKISTPLRSRKGANVVTPKNPVPKSESSSEERLRSPKSPGDMGKTVVTQQEDAEDSKRISPCVTMSRGKANARKEMKQKIDDGLLDEDNSEAESVEHFRRQLASEVARLTEMCDSWEKIKEHTILAEAVQDEVLGAVGQGRLLVSSKLQQFAALLRRCARPEPGAPLVTPADLHGFWDMVFMQIENVDMRFKRLEQRRARDWADEAPAPAQRRPVKTCGGRKAARPAGGHSRLREMIAAARKAKKDQEVQQTQPDSQTDDKTFEAGFFCVRSPVRSPAPATPNNKQNLLKAVLSSEAKKASANKGSSSFAMLRASILCRNLEAEGIAPLPQTPLPQINMNATPGRSILKSTNVKSGKKSIKVVLFNDSDPDVQVTPVKDNIENQNADSGLSSMDYENKENKSKSKARLSRQDAVEDSGVVTRSRRKSVRTPQTQEKVEKNEKPRRSSRRKTLQENDDNVPEVITPVRSSRRRKSNVQAVA
ncbi:guanylate kinase-associated protein mars isoform X2 [Plodia interpunctella]|uniref:guanylate kinase-associated protein mars isoform X2 n=1 Tax=Plodia interpunctella TaxID=58824 RepID=UPI0023680A0D|nr:guanylate kinase-associated protein mars isoform X2 [Plodia interpunctella]